MACCNHTLNFPAIRAFWKAWGPINTSFDVGCAMDYGYDAGEFSGPAMGRMYEQEEKRVAQQVSLRYGLSADELLQQATTCYPMHEQDILISKGLL